MDVSSLVDYLARQALSQTRGLADTAGVAGSPALPTGFGQALTDRLESGVFSLPEQVSALLGNAEEGQPELAAPLPASLGSELSPVVNGQTFSTAGLETTAATAPVDVFSLPAAGPVSADPTGSSLFQSFAGAQEAVVRGRLEGPLQQAILLQVTGIQAAAPGGAYTQGQAPQAGQPEVGAGHPRRPVLAVGEFAATYNQWRQQVLPAPVGLSLDLQG